MIAKENYIYNIGTFVSQSDDYYDVHYASIFQTLCINKSKKKCVDLKFREIWLINHSKGRCCKPHKARPPRGKSEKTAIHIGRKHLEKILTKIEIMS